MGAINSSLTPSMPPQVPSPLSPVEARSPSAPSSVDKSAEQAQPTKAEKCRIAARQAGSIFAAVVFSPVLAVVAAVALCIPQVWTKALLPSVGKEIPPPGEADGKVNGRRTDEFQIPVVREGKKDINLAAMMIRAKGVNEAECAKLPVAVLFCQNANMMQDDRMLNRANEYNELGFNVVLFNYRGVGGSEGRPTRGEDLLEDGDAVVEAVLKGKIPGLGEVPQEKVVLDGTSMGGAVALGVGKKYPKMTVSANHTFSNWNAAAGSLVGNKTAPIIGKVVERLVSATGRAAALDNASALQKRVVAQQQAHRFHREVSASSTIIQTAGRDEILNPHSRLKTDGYDASDNIHEESFDAMTHNQMPGFQSNAGIDSKSSKGEPELPVRETLRNALQPIMEKEKTHIEQALKKKVALLKAAKGHQKKMELFNELLDGLKVLQFAAGSAKVDLREVQVYLKTQLPKPQQEKPGVEENAQFVEKQRMAANGSTRPLFRDDSDPVANKAMQCQKLVDVLAKGG